LPVFKSLLKDAFSSEISRIEEKIISA